LLIIVVASSSPAFGAAIDVARMERAIDLRVSTGQFMGAVLVAKDGKVLINKGYGSAGAGPVWRQVAPGGSAAEDDHPIQGELRAGAVR
jgi:CubicO group peptidase (beta-lactamase class C family)